MRLMVQQIPTNPPNNKNSFQFLIVEFFSLFIICHFPSVRIFKLFQPLRITTDRIISQFNSNGYVKDVEHSLVFTTKNLSSLIYELSYDIQFSYRNTIENRWRCSNHGWTYRPTASNWIWKFRSSMALVHSPNLEWNECKMPYRHSIVRLSRSLRITAYPFREIFKTNVVNSISRCYLILCKAFANRFSIWLPDA